MDPVSASVVIQRPREEVFAYLADIANLPTFIEGPVTEWRLTREDSIGQGAGVRFRAKLRFNRFAYYDITYLSLDAPFRISIVGRGGKYDRTRIQGEITISLTNEGTSKVEWTIDTEPKLLSDSIMETVSGQSGVTRRALNRGLERLRDILETEGGIARAASARVTVAGGPRKPASGFRLEGPGGVAAL